jgi:outer membrane immunogenic protein
MRRLFVALALFGLVSDAGAGEYEIPDLPTLRGSSPFVPAPPTFPRWSGVYAGAQVGFGDAHMDFSGATKQLLAFMLRELALENEQHVSQWKVLGAKDSARASFGGFAGFNSQWDDVVIGLDVHYDKTSFFGFAQGTPISRRTSAGGNVYDVTVDGLASMKIKDWGAGRVRAGYVMGNFLPYGTFGLAVGRAEVIRTATVNGQENPPNPPETCATDVNPPICVPFSYSSTQSNKNTWIFGWAAGLGMDVLVMPDVFLRAEYEYVQFATIAGIKANISTARIGAGLKF